MTAIDRPDGSRPWVRAVPAGWWLRNRRYVLFVLRELSGVFIAIFLILYIVQLAMLASGPDAFAGYLRLMSSPPWIALHVVILFFTVLHTVTWIQLTARIPSVRLGDKKLSQRVLSLAGFVLWVLASAAVVSVVLAS